MPRWLLLHGTPLTAAVWDDTRNHLAGESLAPDMTHAIRAADGSVSVQRAVAEALAHDLSAGSLNVVGHSFGGQVALELALLLPREVEHLTVLCSRLTPFSAFAMAARALDARDEPPIEATLERWFTAEELKGKGPAVSHARANLRHADRHAWSIALDAIATYDRSAESGSMSTPTSLLCAGLDTVSTPDAMAAMAESLPNASLRTFDKWAHMSPFVHPEKLARLLESSADPDLG